MVIMMNLSKYIHYSAIVLGHSRMFVILIFFKYVHYSAIVLGHSKMFVILNFFKFENNRLRARNNC